MTTTNRTSGSASKAHQSHHSARSVRPRVCCGPRHGRHTSAARPPRHTLGWRGIGRKEHWGWHLAGRHPVPGGGLPPACSHHTVMTIRRDQYLLTEHQALEGSAAARGQAESRFWKSQVMSSAGQLSGGVRGHPDKPKTLIPVSSCDSVRRQSSSCLQLSTLPARWCAVRWAAKDNHQQL